MSIKVYLTKEQKRKYGLNLTIDDSLIPDIKNEKDEDIEDVEFVEKIYDVEKE